jgi:hypothetical protein
MMMRRVATLCIKQYKEYRLSAINKSGESIKNREYLIEYESKFEKFVNRSKGLGKSPSVKKSEVKILVGLSL